MSGKALFGPGFARGFSKAWLVAGYLFLYLPIVALVIYSFNDSPIPNVWKGFTLKWYAALPGDREMIAGLCTVLLGNGPKAIEAAKNLIQAVAQKPIDDELMEDTIERIAQIRSTPEAKEGIGAFLAKRRPDWVKE